MEITIDRRGNMEKEAPTIMVPASTRAGITIITTITTTTATTEEITTTISIKIETTIIREKKLRIPLNIPRLTTKPNQQLYKNSKLL
jgi:hypothetical protein